MATGTLLVAVCIVSVAIGIEAEMAQHHVVGGDRGWDPQSDLASWSKTRVFTVGDKIWFTYSAAQEKIVELKTKDEYEACDLSNPIRMFTDGLDVLPLEVEGARYFASGKSESCKNGLKLHVDVQSQPKPNHQKTEILAADLAVADAPTSWASAKLNGLSFGLLAGLFLSYYVL